MQIKNEVTFTGNLEFTLYILLDYLVKPLRGQL